MKRRLSIRGLVAMPAVAVALALLVFMAAPAAAQPLKIGFSMALTGGLAGAGKAALLAMEIWRDDVNAKGGLLGRKVELVVYDDQTKGATVPGIYAKLLDVDKVDFVVSGYGTNLIAPAMPIVMEREMVFMGLFGLDANRKFSYKNYFQIMPAGPEPGTDWSRGFFDLAKRQKPQPKTVAILAADSEFALNAAAGARANAKKLGFRIVYDDRYRPGTPDFTPIARTIKSRNPDLVYLATYPPGAVGMVKASKEVGLSPKMIGGGMVGLQYTAIQVNLGPTLNGIVNYHFWVPEPTMNFPGIEAFLKKYQAKAPAAKLDPLGYYLPPWAYAYVQVLGQAIEATKSVDQKKVADYIRSHTHDTVVGKVKFGPNGEWATSRALMVQFQNIKSNDMSEFSAPGKQVVLYPDTVKSGNLVYPFPGWK